MVRLRYNAPMRSSRPRLLPLAQGTTKELLLTGAPCVASLLTAMVWPTLFTVSLAAILVVLFGLVLFFFRDPERQPPAAEGAFLAPADGEVMEVGRVQEPLFIQGEALRIGIFMSVLSVHVNRSPIDGRVALLKHNPGLFLQAFRPESSELNENNLVGLTYPGGKVLLKQIAGILARRIVCWASVGQELRAGERFGLIKLGSRVEIFVPPDSIPQVELGDKTTAGVTVVARLKASPDDE